MASLVEEIVLVLEQKLSIYNELLILSKEKKQIIIDNDVSLLQKILTSENELVGKIAKLDRDREQLFNDIAFVINKKPEDITVSSLCEFVKGQPLEQKMIQLKDGLIEVSTNLKAENDNNEKLVQLSLEHIEFSVNLIRDAINAPSFYDMTGSEITTQGKSFFDTQQ